ncbi:MAG: hypothetical protein IT223_04650 [Crocinitomicaceae bacterium]|nr:hypothetical protein [Crocinitomicaceae bacterium]
MKLSTLYSASALMAIIVLTTFNCSGQTLEFSQALLISSSSTVPSGKIWKVENILPNASPVASTPNAVGPGSATSTTTTETIIVVNGYNIRTTSSKASALPTNGSGYVNSNAVSTFTLLSGALWLPAGTALAASTNVQYVSVLEFTVVP